jgi:hypothetical protein
MDSESSGICRSLARSKPVFFIVVQRTISCLQEFKASSVASAPHLARNSQVRLVCAMNDLANDRPTGQPWTLDRPRLCENFMIVAETT